ncbi:hypothetical protein B566_EDAN012070 [Ephemera danica]|nr:hypothetical protein B566_EDAN012070 [Ephemera danica]
MNMLEEAKQSAADAGEEGRNNPLLFGSEDWRLHRFLQTHLKTKPFLKDISAPRCLPTRYQQAAMQLLDKTSVAGTVDTARGRWHEVPFAPSNLPDTAQSCEHAITAGNVASKALNVAGKFALAAAVIIDSYRLGKAVYDDMKEQDTLGKRTAKTSASVASGWAGGFAGAAAGNSAGAVIGGTIGAAFGGIGAIPGAAVGSLVGCLVGGVTGGVGASMAAENIVDMINKKQVGVVTKQSLTEILSYEAINSMHNFNEYTTVDNSADLHEVYYISTISAMQDHIREICATPQFFCSFLLLLVLDGKLDVVKDLKEFEQLQEQKLLPSIQNEALCMTDAGFALVWFNPSLGVSKTLETLKPHFPYLEIFEHNII